MKIIKKTPPPVERTPVAYRGVATNNLYFKLKTGGMVRVRNDGTCHVYDTPKDCPKMYEPLYAGEFSVEF